MQNRLFFSFNRARCIQQLRKKLLLFPIRHSVHNSIEASHILIFIIWPSWHKFYSRSFVLCLTIYNNLLSLAWSKWQKRKNCFIRCCLLHGYKISWFPRGVYVAFYVLCHFKQWEYRCKSHHTATEMRARSSVWIHLYGRMFSFFPILCFGLFHFFFYFQSCSGRLLTTTETVIYCIRYRNCFF